MKVFVIGSGGREHALCWALAKSPLLTKLYAAPGNAGIAQLAECKDIQAGDLEGLLAFAKKESVDLTVVGPEAPLVAGIVDLFEKEGLRIFGPSQAAAKLEGSKAFAKDRMRQFGVPTARYEVFKDINEANHYVLETEMPIVIKADGLAAGKGVVICENSQEAVATLNRMMSQNAFGDAGKKVVIEQLLEGEELSILALSDGKNILPLASSQDHKRAYDHDQGPNTGGMGAYSPCPQIAEDQFDMIVQIAVRPMIQGLAKEGTPYRGILYAGMMMTKEGPFVLEYNCRFGDPEAQTVLPRLKSDLLAVMDEISRRELKTQSLEWHDKACMAVVLASGGYPGHYQKGYAIHGLENASFEEDVMVFHAGTARDENGKLVTAGGRVLAVAALGEKLRHAYEKAYQATQRIHFEKSYYRRDIGKKILEVYR